MNAVFKEKSMRFIVFVIDGPNNPANPNENEVNEGIRIIIS